MAVDSSQRLQSTMELSLRTPTLRWQLTAPRTRTPPPPHQVDRDAVPDLRDAEDARCSVMLEHSAQEQPLTLPCTLLVPATDANALDAFLAQQVTFSVLDGDGKVLSTHSVLLRECVPVLTESSISWRESVMWRQTALELSVEIPVVADKEPRELVEKLIRYKRRAHTLAAKLSLHRNAVAIGLFPPLLGCVLGVTATSPVWVPLTLLFAVLGFPIWIVIGIALSFVIVVSTISTLVAVQVVRSKRLQRELKTFLRGPHGQLLLFRGASPDEAQIKTLVMHDPRYKLLASVLIDFIGNATFAVPVFGELADVFWAPFSASMISAMYSRSSPKAKYVAFLEELLPFTDLIPTATIAWVKENVRREHVSSVLASLRQAIAVRHA